MAYTVHDRDDFDFQRPLHVADTWEKARVWVTDMESKYGNYGTLDIYGPNDEPSVNLMWSVPIGCLG